MFGKYKTNLLCLKSTKQIFISEKLTAISTTLHGNFRLHKDHIIFPMSRLKTVYCIKLDDYQRH